MDVIAEQLAAREKGHHDKNAERQSESGEAVFVEDLFDVGARKGFDPQGVLNAGRMWAGV